jgi:hypothetical protein
MAALDPGDGRRPYPETTVDIVKILREADITVEFDDQPSERAYVGHKALEVWLPILEISGNYLLGISGGLMTWLITEYLTKQTGNTQDDEAIIHVTYRVLDDDGRPHEITLRGPKTDVCEALNEFESRVVDRTRLDETEEGSATNESRREDSDDRGGDD